MSIFTKFHDAVAKFLGVGAEDVQQFVQQALNDLTERVAPLLDKVRADVAADGKQLFAQAEDDAKALIETAVADIKTEIADLKAAIAALQQAAAPAPAKTARHGHVAVHPEEGHVTIHGPAATPSAHPTA